MATTPQLGSQGEAPEGVRLESAMRQSDLMVELRRLLGLAVEARPAIAAAAGMSLSELNALEHLMESPLGPADLSRRLGVTSAAGSGIVDRLEQRGHVMRNSHAHDRRRTTVLITESGRQEVLQRLVPMFQQLAGLESRLSADERAIVIDFLRGACGALETATGHYGAAPWSSRS